MSYEILSDHDVSIPRRNITARRVVILIDAKSPDEAAPLMTQAARDLLTGDALDLYAYIEREAVRWQGWVGRVEYRAEGVPKLFFDNDPVMRKAVYMDVQAQQGETD